MGDPKETSKAAKKAFKAQAKLEKKRAEAGACPRPTSVSAVGAGPRASGDARSTPAERAAAAAERQVALQRYRVWISLIVALVGLATLLATVRPWRWLDTYLPHRDTTTTVDDEPK